MSWADLLAPNTVVTPKGDGKATAVNRRLGEQAQAQNMRTFRIIEKKRTHRVRPLSVYISLSALRPVTGEQTGCTADNADGTGYGVAALSPFQTVQPSVPDDPQPPGKLVVLHG